MWRIVGLAFVYVFVVSYTTFGVEAGVGFGKCILYFRNEVLTELENGERICVQSGNLKICREAPCPDLSCDISQLPSDISQLPSTSISCPFCPDQCVNGGKVYTLDQRFKHMDGVNFCRCHENNMITCSKLPTNERNLCF